MRSALRAPVRRPRWVLLIALAVVVLAGWSVARLEPVPSLAPMFASDDPAAQAMVRMLDDFSAADSLLVLVRAPASDDQPRESLFNFARRLDREVERDEALSGMLTSLTYTTDETIGVFVREHLVPAGLYYLDEEQFDEFEARLAPERIASQIRRNEGMLAAASPTAEAVTERVLQDPLRLHELLFEAMRPVEAGVAVSEDEEAFIGRDGRSLLIRVRAKEPAGELAFTRRLMASMREAVDRADPGALTVAYAGGYPIAELSERVIRRDMIFSVVCSVIMLQVLFLVVYRGLWNFPLAFAPVAAGILAGFGVYAALLSTQITPVIAASGAILAGLGVDYCIHYLSHYHTHRRAGHDAAGAASLSLSLAPALGAACVTSLIGFGALLFSGVPALRDFALIGALGLGGAFLGALLFLPALLQVFDARRTERQLSMRWHLEPLVHGVSRWARTCVVIGALVGVGGVAWLAVAGLPPLETDMTVMQPRPNPPMQTQARIAEQFPGATESLPVYLQASSWPELIALAHRVDRRLATPALRRQGVTGSLSVARVLPNPARLEARRARIASLDADRIVSDFQQAIEASAFAPQAYEAYADFLRQLLRPGEAPGVEVLVEAPELGGMLLPRGAARGDGAVDDGEAPRALTLVRFVDEAGGGAERLRVVEAVESALASVPGATVTGMEVVGQRVRATIESELPLLLSVAAAVVLIWLMVVFRRPAWVALVAIPPAVCLVAVAVMMQATGTRLNPVNLLAIPLLAGIGVDDGIFLMSRAARARRAGTAVADLVQSLAASCHAITLTSLTTLLAFGSLLLTSTPAIQSLGLMLMTGMLGCWFASVFVLTPLLIANHRRSDRGGGDGHGHTPRERPRDSPRERPQA